MAEGIIRGVVKDERFDAKQIYVYDIIPQRVEWLQKEYGINGCTTTQAAAEQADIIVFAVRPQDAENVSKQVKSYLSDKCVFVSICAGVTIEKFANLLGRQRKIVRIMPNTLTEAHHGYSAVCLNENTSEEDAQPVIAMMEAIGQVMRIKEDAFNVFTAYSCTGPAYLLYIMTAMIDAGVRAGFARKDARAITIENMIGTAIKLEQSGMHPYQILDTMTSPGGVGIEAIYSMEQKGVSSALMYSVQEAARRSEELA